MEDHDTLYELCERWQELEQQRWTTAELQRRRARLALDYPGDNGGEEEAFGDQVSIIYGATTNKQGFKVGHHGRFETQCPMDGSLPGML